jgi:predicted small metal-binding protein
LAGLTAGSGGPDLKCADPYERILMSYSLACGDVVEGCATTFEAGSEDELMARVADHARDDHGVTEISPELAEQVKGAVKTS